MGIRFSVPANNIPKPFQNPTKNARFQPQALQILSKTDVKSKISASSPPNSFQTQNKIKDFSLKPFKISQKPYQSQRFQPPALQIPPKPAHAFQNPFKPFQSPFKACQTFPKPSKCSQIPLNASNILRAGAT